MSFLVGRKRVYYINPNLLFAKYLRYHRNQRNFIANSDILPQDQPATSLTTAVEKERIRIE
jgi:hypothetical protein